MSEPNILLKWEVTSPAENFRPKNSGTILTGSVILVSLLIVAYSWSSGVLFDYVIMVPVFLVICIYAIYFVWVQNNKTNDAIIEYKIIKNGIYRYPKSRYDVENKMTGFLVWDYTLLSKPLGMASVYYRPFETIDHYKIDGQKIILKPKKILENAPVLFTEFVIIPNNNREEIIAILDKFLKKAKF